MLTVGEDEARTMGINTKLIRFITIICATLLTSASVAVSGMIGWIDLVIPHLSKKLVGNNFVYL
ncbi:iron chelate uptake ABC transporter family permease subunit [Terrisporobacter petrolearius]|uniref:iron chelate uptake ABC transporter family permease subunit n=1 Tax=Terrisporobacter petrolearius TaxID=1460447 RepID=UPI0034DD2F32